jgi:hypothetical protein
LIRLGVYKLVKEQVFIQALLVPNFRPFVEVRRNCLSSQTQHTA